MKTQRPKLRIVTVDTKRVPRTTVRNDELDMLISELSMVLSYAKSLRKRGKRA